MKVTVKLYAGLAVHLPADSRNHATEVEVDAGASPNLVLDRFGVPRESAHLMLLNGIYLKPPERDKAMLQDGDILAAWPPVAGGQGQAPGQMDLTLEREMTITHDDFYRLLPRALEGFDFDRREDGIEARGIAGRIRIQLDPERRRRIASLELPVTRVKMELSGFEGTDARAFLARFDLAYRKGGG